MQDEVDSIPARQCRQWSGVVKACVSLRCQPLTGSEALQNFGVTSVDLTISEGESLRHGLHVLVLGGGQRFRA